MPLNLNLRCYGVRILFSLFLIFAWALSTFPQNAIVTENTKAGAASSQWDIINNGDGTFGDKSIQGFATDISVNKGQTINFKITITTGTDFKYGIKIYRIGYYQGNGARLIGDLGTAFTGKKQNACSFNNTTGLTDCGNWTLSASWAVPSTAVPGIYLAKLTRSAAGGGGSSHIAFIVRDDASTSALCFKTSDATWQAYNSYGGYSLYVGAGMPFNHGDKVSYNRPFLTRDGGGGGGSAEDWFMNAEYPMIRFLERNGFDLTYTTDVDVARSGTLLLNHKIFMSVGHDEYWSKEERNSVEAVRAAGKHLAFFSGNESYWKTRWENSVDGTNTPFRTMVCYKEGTLPTPGENPCGGKCDPTAEWTGLWRDGCSFPSGNACKPENGLSGEISWDGNTGTMQVPATYKNLRFWRNTSIASLASGQTATLTAGTLGYEWDWEQYASSYPAGRITMSNTSFDGHVHKLSFYKASNGALVFGAGTVQWSWGLDASHDRGTAAANTNMQQATINLFADMGVQPGTLQSGLVAATASTDHTPPTAAFVSPVNGSSTTLTTPLTISGTASDAATVAVVEISFDGGATWTQANGTTSWTYTWAPPGNGVYTIKVRGVDDSGNYPDWASAASISFTVNSAVTCPCTVFGTNVPTVTAERDNTTGIVVGMKFKTSVSGTVSGIKFYKVSGNTGTHQGLLYNSAGTLLAQATFTGETASGWQQVNFSNPVSISANQTYVAAYLSGSGFYNSTSGYFTSSVPSGPLTALADGSDGPNGVYIYSRTPAYPINTFQKSNYWVDLIYNNSGSAAVVANAGPDQTITLPTSSITLNGNSSTGSISNYAWSQVSGPANATISSPSAVNTTVNGLIQGVYSFKLSVNNGASSDQVSVTVNAATGNSSIFSTQLPGSAVQNDGQALELGVKFRSSVAGSVSGIRFYKTAGNSGTHTGELYNSSGARLAQAVFTGETASGWQTVTFSSPVAISANTTYIAAYHSGSGNYTSTANYFQTAIANGSLTALADGTDGVNGVYTYSATPAFPVSSFQKSNYWVDLVFSSTSTVIANAGPNQTITLPNSSVTLNGSGSSGTISGYLWTQVSGPNAASIATPAAVSTTVTGLIQGTYVFRLSLNGGVSTAQVTITVNPAPVANAGSNQTIILPASTVTLNGSGSTGTITSYLWTQVSGPNTSTINSPAAVSTTVVGLIQGTYVYKLSLNSGASSSQLTINVIAGSSASNIFTTQTPATATENDGKALELGVKFRSTVAGTIQGIRFYKSAGNSGTHTGELYSSTGTRLAQAVFTSETASGWQQILFSSPVSISANTTYIAAYFSSAGNYVSTPGYFASALVNGSLTALADGTDGVNGVYNYATTPTFPTLSFSKSNYWVDVLFNAGTTSGTSSQQAQIIGIVKTEDSTQGKLTYYLGQNYPNPFSQTSKINFAIPSRSFVELVLFDMQGRLVKVMVNDLEESGNHVYELSTSNLAKGIYYYRMRAGNYLATRKLMIQ